LRNAIEAMQESEQQKLPCLYSSGTLDALRRLMLVQLSDTRDDLRDFGIIKRWTAAYAVPCQQQFQCDLVSMPRHSKCPVSDAMVELRWLSCTPSRTSRRHSSRLRPTRGRPLRRKIQRGRAAGTISAGERPGTHGLAPSARMHGRRGNDVAAVAAHIDALRQPGTIAHKTARVGEIQVSATAAGRHLRGHWKRCDLTFQAFD
jgi:hypothetical protein